MREDKCQPVTTYLQISALDVVRLPRKLSVKCSNGVRISRVRDSVKIRVIFWTLRHTGGTPSIWP